MNTFHITPIDPLARQVAEEVTRYPPDTFIAIRGQTFNEIDSVYTVSPHPDQDNPKSLEWTYVRAGDWLQEFDIRRR